MPQPNPVLNPSGNIPKQVPTCVYPGKCVASNSKAIKKGLTVAGEKIKILVAADMARKDFGKILSMQNLDTN